MRILLLLRGSAGCGKSTFIEKNGLTTYALSADNIRLLCQSPLMKINGEFTISQRNDSIVWKLLFGILETRMKLGEFTVIDATNSKTSEINKYKKLCDKYRYRIYCVDFTDVPIEETKRRNRERDHLKIVPESAIDKFYSRFKTQNIPSGVTVIKPDEIDSIWIKPIDLSRYKKIHHIGDIHGCYTALKTYLDSNGGVKEDEFYIFTGDYIDRGIENAEVIRYLFEIQEKENVIFLEGNHERWLWKWANNIKTESREFENVTRKILENENINKKDVRRLYRKMRQCAYYTYDHKVFLITHGGISTFPENLSFISTEQLIKGVGNYNETQDVDNTFYETTPDNYYQIHGHRNPKGLPVKVNNRVYNLEGQVELGGNLRCVQITHNNINVVETKNNLFKSNFPIDYKDVEVDKLIGDFRSNKYIIEKSFGNISSFNFSSRAFYDKKWDQQTVKARGLYLDTIKNKVVARSYDKFFNINERNETTLQYLRQKFKFPVTAYVKENGFLGIISYDKYNDELFITTKSSVVGKAAQLLKQNLYQKVGDSGIKKIKEYLEKHDVSLVVECIDIENDPHIIEYSQNDVILLDIIENELSFFKYPYQDMCRLANEFGLKYKQKAYEISDWAEFFDWYQVVISEDYKYSGEDIEGFVIEDTNGYMVKLKLSYYIFWKKMRSVAMETIHNGYTKRPSLLYNAVSNEFYGFIKCLVETDGQENIPHDICSLRKMFYAEKAKEE